MHVAVGHADRGGRDASLGLENRVGIGSRPAGIDLRLERDAGLLADLAQTRVDDGMVHAPDADDGALAHLHVAVLGLGAVGDVGGVGDVDHQRHVGVDPVSGHRGPVESVLLLDRGDGDQACLEFSFFERGKAQSLGRRPGADTVVASSGREATSLEFLEFRRVGDGVTDRHELLGLLARGDADVDVHRVEIGHLLAVVGLLQVDGQQTGDPGNGTVLTVHGDALTAHQGVVDASDPLDREIPLVGDVGDHEAELVHVPADEHTRVALTLGWIERREGVAVGIGLHGIGKARDIVDPDLLTTGLKAGGGGGVEERLEELVRFHG